MVKTERIFTIIFIRIIKNPGIMAKPIRVKVYYDVHEKIFQNGVYLVKGKKINGHRDYYYRSALWLMWNLPRSREKLLKAIRKWSWKSMDIAYDQSKFDFNKRRQDHYSDFNENNELIEKYDRFNGEERTIVSSLSASNGPGMIKVCYDNGREEDISVTTKKETLQRVRRVLQ